MRYTLVLMLSVSTLVGCRAKSTSAPDPSPSASSAATQPIDAFWTWFAQNGQELRVQSDMVACMQRITEQLAKIDPGVLAEIGDDHGERLLVLTADGKKELFPLIEKVYAARRSVPGWKVVAFRQRDESGTPIEMNGQKLDPKAMKFAARRSNEKLDVVVYVPGFTTAEAMGNVLFIALDHTVGEYDLETRIGTIDFAKLEDAPASARPLTELGALIDTTFRKK